MKADTQVQPILVPQEECEVLNLIRDDHELIERLSITSEELEALSKCAMFGTLTCKQHMLAILRQIREAGGGIQGLVARRCGHWSSGDCSAAVGRGCKWSLA